MTGILITFLSMLKICKLRCRYYKIELCLLSVTGFLNGKQQPLIKDPVGVVLCHTRKEKLTGDQFSIGSLNFHVDMLCAACVDPGDDGC